MKRMSGSAVAYAGYVFVLLGFISLGLFVVSLAVRSPRAVPLGIAAVVAFTTGVTGFRVGKRRGASVWRNPMSASDLEHYEAKFRGIALTSARPRYRPTGPAESPQHRQHQTRRPVPSVHGRYRAIRSAVRAPQPRMRRAH